MFKLGWRQLLLLAGFVAALAAADRLLGRRGLTLVEPHVNEKRAEVLYAYATLPEPEDVLVIGSSRVAGGLDARVLNEEMERAVGQPVPIYKLGLAGLRPLLLSEVLEGMVAQRPPRRLLVISIEYRYFVTPGWAPPGRGGQVILPRADGAAEREAAGRGREAIRGEWESDVVVADVWKAFRGLRTLWQADWFLSPAALERRAFRQQTFGEQWTPEERAAYERAFIAGAADLDHLDLKPGMAWYWSPPEHPDQLGWRRSLDVLQRLQDGGACQVVFIRMPLAAGFEEQQMAGVGPVFSQLVVAELEQRGFRYVDLSRPPYPQEPRYYVGLTHLNMQGAVLTSRLFVRELLAPWWQRTQQ